MECVIQGLNLVTAPELASGSTRPARPPAKRRRWQPAEIEFLFTGRAAFRKLQTIVAELSRTAEESSDVVVVLLPQNLMVKKIEYTEVNTLFVCEGRSSSRTTTISIPNGRPFSAVIEVVARGNRTRLVTGFVDRLQAGPEAPLKNQARPPRGEPRA